MVGESATISISGFVARTLVNSYREGIATSRPVRAKKVISTIHKIKGGQFPDINDWERL